MQVSRRGFLIGRRAPDPLAGCLALLRAVAPGAVWVRGGGLPSEMYVRPTAWDAVPQVCALAREQSLPLRLAVAGLSDRAVSAAPACVVLDVGALRRCEPVPDLPGAWLAEPGCLAGDLARLGLTQFDAVPPGWTLARWAAEPATPWRVGACADSGVRAADVLFDDGTVETLGVFGSTNTRPLRSARVQRLVPALFELARHTARSEVREGARYEGFRLDALQADAGGGINLSHLMLGHAGYLALPLRWLLVAGLPAAHGCAGRDARSDDGIAIQDAVLHGDAAVRHAFDPLQRFGGVAAVWPQGSTANGPKE